MQLSAVITGLERDTKKDMLGENSAFTVSTTEQVC